MIEALLSFSCFAAGVAVGALTVLARHVSSTEGGIVKKATGEEAMISAIIAALAIPDQWQAEGGVFVHNPSGVRIRWGDPFRQPTLTEPAWVDLSHCSQKRLAEALKEMIGRKVALLLPAVATPRVESPRVVRNGEAIVSKEE